MLNALRVDVYFEIEKLYISDPKAVKMLTIYAGLYHHESECKSYATRWGIVTRFQDGSSKICDWPCYGYRKTENGDLVPDQEEATVVRQIYRWNHDGYSPGHSCQADRYASPVSRRRDEMASRDGTAYPEQ